MSSFLQGLCVEVCAGASGRVWFRKILDRQNCLLEALKQQVEACCPDSMPIVASQPVTPPVAPTALAPADSGDSFAVGVDTRQMMLEVVTKYGEVCRIAGIVFDCLDTQARWTPLTPSALEHHRMCRSLTIPSLSGAVQGCLDIIALEANTVAMMQALKALDEASTSPQGECG